MNEYLLLISSFLYGISSSFHCISMCGPFVGSLNIMHHSKIKNNLIYNFGRLTSYSIIGTIMGFLGLGINLTIEIVRIQNISIILSGIFILITGFALIFNKKLLPDSKINIYIKKLLNPLLNYLNEKKKLYTFSFLFGVLTGLLPCAVLYPAFAISFATASPKIGMLSMLFFFFGTLPGMLFFGLGFQKIKKYFLKEYATLTGLAIIFIGLGTIYFRMNHKHVHIESNKQVHEHHH